MAKKIDLLITRPLQDAIAMSKNFNVETFKLFIAPLIKIEKVSYVLNKKDYDLVIFTSKNGIRNFNDKITKSKIFVIGEGTYELAIQNGMKKVINIDGDIKDLKEKIKPYVKKKKEILHPTSKIKNEELLNFFSNFGCHYDSLGCYDSKSINANQKIFENFFHSPKVGLVTLFSTKTAISFKDEISKLNLLRSCRNKNILVLSKTIANVVDTLPKKNVFISEKPNEQSMVNLIDEICKQENLIG